MYINYVQDCGWLSPRNSHYGIELQLRPFYVKKMAEIITVVTQTLLVLLVFVAEKYLWRDNQCIT